MTKEFYAKDDKKYREHIEEVYFAWREIVKSKEKMVERIAAKYQISKEYLIQISLLTIVLHDLGKMLISFQDMMEAKRIGKNFNYQKNYRHELVSFVYILHAELILKKRNEIDYSDLPLASLAVAGHHKMLDGSLSSFEKEKVHAEAKLDPGGLVFALNVAEDILGRECGLKLDFLLDLENQNWYDKLLLVTQHFSQMIQQDDREKIRAVYVFLKGVLHYADWVASSRQNIKYYVEKDMEEIINSLIKRCYEKNIEFKGLRIFQEKVADVLGNLIAVAPTGSGKTEASVLWALNNLKDLGGAKIIYLLPTITTANSIWERLSDFFGRENVGLSHSSANLIFHSEEQQDDYSVNTRGERSLLFDRSFIRPVTVATVDQFLTTGFNRGKWTVKEVNAGNSVIVLDEIHAYNGWTLGLIISAIKYFAAQGSRFLLMSATMPGNLVDLFKKTLPQASVVKDNELLKSIRSQYFVVDKLIDEDLDKIKEAVLIGKKVLVVVNTVAKCQELAEYFRELKPICFHARFILKDKQKITEAIETTRFLIATQIVEVALDIDFDWLFTECAPPDAIAQRAGRINRYRDPKRDSRVYIYNPDIKSEKLYNPLNDKTFLKNTLAEFTKKSGAVTEQDLLDIIERVYSNIPFENREGFSEGLEQYKKSQKRKLIIFDDTADDKEETTRRKRYETVSVLPYCFYDEILKSSITERKLYEVRIPYWYFYNHKRYDNGIVFCDLKYDDYLGVLLQEDDSTYSL